MCACIENATAKIRTPIDVSSCSAVMMRNYMKLDICHYLQSAWVDFIQIWQARRDLKGEHWLIFTEFYRPWDIIIYQMVGEIRVLSLSQKRIGLARPHLAGFKRDRMSIYVILFRILEATDHPYHDI